MRPAGAAAAALLALAAGGCAAPTGAIPADVMAPGAHEVTGGVGAGVAAAKLAPGKPAPLPSIVVGGGYRRGVSERLEWGARGWAIGMRGFSAYGAATDLKIGLRDGRRRGGRFHLSLDPRAAYHRFDYGGSYTHFAIGSLALLAGWDLGERRQHQIVAGLRAEDHYMFGPDLHPVNSVFGGASVGVAWRVSRWFEVRPELSLLYSPIRFNGVMDDPQRRGMTLVQLGIGGAYELGVR